MKQSLTKPQLAFGLGLGVLSFLILYRIVELPVLVNFWYVTFFLTIWLFEGAVHAKGMVERSVMSTFGAWVNSPLIVLVLLLDITWNASIGVVVFHEYRERLFSWHVQWVLDHAASEDWKYVKRALFWARFLNAIDPGHINIPELLLPA